MNSRCRRIPGVLLLLFLSLAGCGGGGAGHQIASNFFFPPNQPFTNLDRNQNSPDCSTAPAVQLVSPSGHLYSCLRFVVKFEASASSDRTGTYTVRTGFTQGVLGDTILESGTWNLLGKDPAGRGIIEFTKDGQTMTTSAFIVSNDSAPNFPGFVDQIQITFTTGAFAGQTVAYSSIFNAV